VALVEPAAGLSAGLLGWWLLLLLLLEGMVDQ
jgi:hypothetical protein